MYGNFKIATLTEEQIKKIRDLETTIQKHIMALEPGVSIARLNKEELRMLEALEKELGVVLLTYEEVD